MKQTEARIRQLKHDIKKQWEIINSIPEDRNRINNEYQKLIRDISHVYHELFELVDLEEEDFRLWLGMPQEFYAQSYIQGYVV